MRASVHALTDSAAAGLREIERGRRARVNRERARGNVIRDRLPAPGLSVVRALEYGRILGKVIVIGVVEVSRVDGVLGVEDEVIDFLCHEAAGPRPAAIVALENGAFRDEMSLSSACEDVRRVARID